MNRFEGQFSKTATNEIIRMLNSGKSNPGVVPARIEWELELKAELLRRGVVDYDQNDAHDCKTEN